jgi:hypothetical protein
MGKQLRRSIEMIHCIQNSQPLTLPVNYCWRTRQEDMVRRIECHDRQIGSMAYQWSQVIHILMLTRKLVARDKDSLDTLLRNDGHANDAS